jgi:dUTP pyrophosphatase
MISIKVKKLYPQATIPSRAHDNDAGFDMVATTKTITPLYVQYGTGIAMHIPDGYVGLIFPRSSVTKQNLMLKNSVGVIDAGYRGEISFRFQTTQSFNLTDDNPYLAQDYKRYDLGDKIGQIIIIKLPAVELVETDDLEDSERGAGSYGSTDKK